MEKDQGCHHLRNKADKVKKLQSTISSTTEKYVCQQCLEVVMTDEANGLIVVDHIKRLEESGNIWICPECEMVHCGGELHETVPYGHVVRHALKLAHPLAVSVVDQSVYCVECKTTTVQSGKTPDLVVGDKKKQVEELPPETSNKNLRCRYLIISLPNMGNTCYFNSVLQNLLMMNILRDHYVALEQDKNRPITYSLGRHYHITRPDAEPKNTVHPTVLFNRVCENRFKKGQQQDCHELLMVFLESLRQEELGSRKKKANEDPTFIELVFQGKISRTISCLVCGETSTHAEAFMDLSLLFRAKKGFRNSKALQTLSHGCRIGLNQLRWPKCLIRHKMPQSHLRWLKCLIHHKKTQKSSQVPKVLDSSPRDPKHNTENRAEEILDVFSYAIDGETDSEDEVTSKDTSKISAKDSGCDDLSKVDDEQVVKGSVSSGDFMTDITKIAKDFGGEDVLKAADVDFKEDPALGIVTSFEDFAQIYGRKDIKGEDVCEVVNLPSNKNPRLDDMGRVKSPLDDVAIKKGCGGVDLGSDKESKIGPAFGSKATVIGQSSLFGGFYLSDEEEVDNSTDVVSVESCLKAYTATEDLSKDKNQRCDNCNKNARKYADNKAQPQLVAEGKSDKKAEGGSSMEIELCPLDIKKHKTMRVLIKKTPPILTIHLLRFKTFTNGVTRKIHGHIAFNETLDLAPYMESREGTEACVVYRLLGVIQHEGMMGFGHYKAYIRGGQYRDGENDGDEWYCADDDKVTKVALEDVLRCDAYILFYRRLRVITIPLPFLAAAFYYNFRACTDLF